MNLRMVSRDIRGVNNPNSDPCFPSPNPLSKRAKLNAEHVSLDLATTHALSRRKLFIDRSRIKRND